MVRFLISNGVNVNAISKSTTPLVAALTNRNKKIAKILIEAGAKLNLTSLKNQCHSLEKRLLWWLVVIKT